jgi:hypothetical protein
MKKNKYIIPEIKNKQYIFSESVCGGYLQNSSWAFYDIVSSWNKDLKMLKIEIEKKDVTNFFDKEGKLKKDNFGLNEGEFNFHKNRVLRARNRHLECLKIFLGISKLEEIQQKKFIYRKYYDWDIEIGELSITKKGEPNIKESRSMVSTEWTKEKEQLVKEYNENRAKYKKEEKRLDQLIFGE